MSRAEKKAGEPECGHEPVPWVAGTPQSPMVPDTKGELVGHRGGNGSPTLRAGLCLAAVGWFSFAQAADPAALDSPSGASLAVQTESAYVTDPSRWGKLIFEPSRIDIRGGSKEDAKALATLIERYHRAWLSRDSEATKELLDPEISRFRQGRLQLGLADVSRRMANESRGERPEGYSGSSELAIRDVRIQVTGDTATAFYRIDTHTGARWEYADLATVFQAFRKTDGRWALFHHVESTRLHDPSAPALPADVPSRRAPFVLDFVYPVENLQRAIAFYKRFLGEPERVTTERASFRLVDSRFELEAKPLDERITIKKGAGNGYGIISVRDLKASRRALATAGAARVDAPRACGPDLCVIAEDPSGNIVVWRERRPSISAEPVRPSVSLEASGDSSVSAELEAVSRAWVKADRDALLRHVAEGAHWVDDSMADHPLGVAAGRQEIGRALEARWEMIDRGPDGLALDLEIRDLRQRKFGDRKIVTFDMILRHRGVHASVEHAFVSQIWAETQGKNQLESSFIAWRRQFFDRPVNSMDYTAYPLNDLGKAGRFYKTVLGSEPYRDANWFGFWSTSSVFGMFEKESETTPFRPYPHRSNGYADMSIRSADETLRLLKETGARLPHVPGINNQAGIDANPGYNQILAIDPEGNLINFSEYLEY